MRPVDTFIETSHVLCRFQTLLLLTLALLPWLGSGAKDPDVAPCLKGCWKNYMACMRSGCPYNKSKVGRETKCWKELEACQTQCHKELGSY